ncbi:hypothetical protein AVEN_165698-1 [Araneus ventricosus]|uniref:Uncharacterized protein n=1 Tax=Araneus ventricosus TaxID=182803 RepID=A0A4Y2C314_ARAVE|nr:hypothetical protein AVEN_165698-1 [Araneus ventricosus]
MEHGTCLNSSLQTELKAQVDPVIQRNSYFDHPENLLIAMLTDSELHIVILKARGIQENGFRLFQLPTVKFVASSYTDLIDWQENIADPPILKSIPDKDIRLFAVQEAHTEPSLLHLTSCTHKRLKRQLKR